VSATPDTNNVKTIDMGMVVKMRRRRSGRSALRVLDFNIVEIN
jgi:hypothetical protein